MWQFSFHSKDQVHIVSVTEDSSPMIRSIQIDQPSASDDDGKYHIHTCCVAYSIPFLI